MTATSGRLIHQLRRQATRPGEADSELETLSVAFGPGGWTLTSGGDSRWLILHDAATGEIKRRVRPETLGCLHSVVLTPDGETLAAAETDSPLVRLWDWETGEEQPGLEGHTRPVTCLAVSRDGRTLATGSWDRRVCLWDLATHTRTAVLHADRDAIRRVALAADGLTVAFAHGQTVEIRRVRSRSK